MPSCRWQKIPLIVSEPPASKHLSVKIDLDHDNSMAVNNVEVANGPSTTRRRGALNPAAQSFFRKLHQRVSAKNFPPCCRLQGQKVTRRMWGNINFVIRSSESLDMLLRPWVPASAPNDMGDLPSWICRLDRSPFRPGPALTSARVNEDLHLGFLHSAASTYSASAMTKPTTAAFNADSRCLYVKGMVLDDIGDFKAPATEENVSTEWLKIADRCSLGEGSLQGFLARSLVGNRDHKGQSPPWCFRRACQ